MNDFETLLAFCRAMKKEAKARLSLFNFMLQVPRTFWLVM